MTWSHVFMLKASKTAKSSTAPVAVHRRRMKQDGLVRVEVKVRKQDVALVRGVVRALSDPGQAAEARAILSQRFASPPSHDFKALLAMMPLDEIDLERPRDTGRTIDL
jgi:hypothetical protein